MVIRYHARVASVMNIPDTSSKAAILLESAIKYRSILHGLDTRRIYVYRLYYSFSFTFISNICVGILFILPFFEFPSSLTISSDIRRVFVRPEFPCGVLESIEFLCLSIFLVRALLLSFLFWRSEFLRNKWLIGQLVVLVISYTDVIVSISMGCSEFYRIRRFLRPYFLICNSQMLKKTIKCLWNTLPELASFLLLLMLWILSATVAAMCIFSGPLRSTNKSTHFYAAVHDGSSWLYDTFYNLIVLLTTANHPDVILQNYISNRATSLFDIIFIAIGTYIFMNIFTAIMYYQFRGYLFSSVQKQLFRRRVAVRAAFEVMKSRHPIPTVDSNKVLQLLDETPISSWKKAVISNKLMTQYSDEPLTVNEFMDLFRLLDLVVPPSTPIVVRQFTNYVAYRAQSLFMSVWFRRIELIVCLVNVLCIILQLVVFEDANTPSFTFLIINTFFAFWYVTEIALSIWVYGWRNFLAIPITYFDLFVSSCNLILRFVEIALITIDIQHVDLHGWSPYDFGQLANLLVILRTLRFTRTSAVMTTVLLQMPRHLAPVLGILSSVYYIYGLLGLCLFRGAIRHPDVNSTLLVGNTTYTCGTYQQLEYWSINFDDFAASIFTLWSLMVLNNWHVIVNAFTDELGRWVHFYMISWWLIAAVILLTLTTAMIIESFLFARQEHSRRSSILEARKRRRTNACPLTLVAPTSSRHRQIIDDDMEELMPAFEESNNAHEFQPAPFPSTSEQTNNTQQEEAEHGERALTFGLTQIFGQNLHEPSNEEIVQHLQRHSEFATPIAAH